MTLKNRIEKLENISHPEEIKITTNLWDETKEPWPSSPEAKKAYEAKIGMKCFWVERSKNDRA